MHELEGGTSARADDASDGPSLVGLLDEYRGLATWVLPPGVGTAGFVGLHSAVLVGTVWIHEEWIDRRTSRPE